MSSITTLRLWLFAFVLAFAPLSSVRADAENAPSFLSVIPGLAEQHLAAEYWVARSENPDHLRFSSERITALNARQLSTDPSLHDLNALPDSVGRKQVRNQIRNLSQRPSRELFDGEGGQISGHQIDSWLDALALDRLPRRAAIQFALVTRRADLRTFPTTTRVFSAPGDTDIDRFQESVFFPGTAVAVVHQTRDRLWHFVIGERYAAWIEADAVAIGERATVLGYAMRTPALIVTGAQVRSVQTTDTPALSALGLDMGVRLPLHTAESTDDGFNGQAAFAHHVIHPPLRQADGSLRLQPALLPYGADVRSAPLPHTAANILRQSFKFLGERYGWGHADNGRDCSGFVSEVYASMGITLPRNTGDQNKSAAFDRIALGSEVDHAARVKIFGELAVGDLIFIPGHVMMVIGQQGDGPWVIHDAYNIAVRHPDASISRHRANGVIVTPFNVLALDDGIAYIDAATAIQRIR